jgi:rod shape-determining protein MreD
MIRKAACLAFGVFLMIFESSLSSSLPLELAKPDLGVPFIIYGTFFLSPAEGLLAAVLFGFTEEVLSNSPAGALIFTNVALLLSCVFLRNRLYIQSRYTFSLVCGASALGESLIFLALSLLAKGETKNISNVLVFSIPDAIMTAFVSLLMFHFFEQLKIRYMSRV